MVKRKKNLFILLLLALVLPFTQAAAQNTPALFTLLKPQATNLKFTNMIRENDSLHVLMYEYLYNGHGIGIADFNHDGLQDIFISGNAVDHKLFINQGDFKFEDVTRQAGVKGNGTWGTGVSIADVNGDGLPDIYVCHSGKYPDAKLANELFINQGIVKGVPRFREESKAYGLDAPGTQSTQAAFFDYDRDGDLDMFMLNHSLHTHNAFLNTKKLRATPDMRYGNRLFRNDGMQQKNADAATHGPVFTDVTRSSGILNNPINYGLSVNVSDINQDGWPDLYTTSDYSEQDCYYVNNGNGTFTQSIKKSFHHISKFSMGADIADFNNDGMPDVFTLDMLPEDNHRQKLLKGPDQYDQYQLLIDSGFFRQHMRNMLHINRGKDSDGNVRFSEIGQLAGVSNTDWSWAGLLADFDNDGWKDLLVTNGYLRDFTDLDFLKYTLADAQFKAATEGTSNFKTYSLVQKMPSNKPGNYIFRNRGDLTFSNMTKAWGLDVPSISNAAAYADLDNDGDLDLVIGNNNEPVMVWKNNAPAERKWLQLKLEGSGENTAALGARIRLYAGGNVQYLEQYPIRGFQSSVSPVLHFGLPSPQVDSLKVEWPSGKTTTLNAVESGRLLSLREADAADNNEHSKLDARPHVFKPSPDRGIIPFTHRENEFIDFKGEVLLPYQLSRMGPALAKADVNADGNEDVFIGGAIGQAGVLYLQRDNGSFEVSPSAPWNKDMAHEDVNALFFDADNDGDIDLYVVSGGNEYEDHSVEYQDRIYINDGKGNFAKAVNALPQMGSSKQAVSAGDVDRDGDMDLFVGGRGQAGKFPLPSRSYLLRNDSKDGQVTFTDVTTSLGEGLALPGMVTAATWADFGADGYPDLLLAGDWMPLMLFKNDKGRLKDISRRAQLINTSGQWGALLATDIDNDGDVDIIGGNAGLNTQYQPSLREPLTMHVADFDDNGNIDPIISYFIQGKSYPMASRDELLDHIRMLRSKYIRYSDYADATVETIFTKQQLEKSKVLTCNEARTMIFINNGDLTFLPKELPIEAQFSKTSSILSDDFDADGRVDLLLLGNFYPYRPQLGESDASYGLYLRGEGNGTFTALAPHESGLFADGDVRRAVVLTNKMGNSKLVIGKNDGPVDVISIQRSALP